MSTTFTNTGNFTGNLTGTGTNSANTNTGMATGTGTGSWANSTHSVIWMSRSGKSPAMPNTNQPHAAQYASLTVAALLTIAAASNLIDVYGSALSWTSAAIPATIIGSLVALAGLVAGAAERDALVEHAVVAHNGGLADDDAHGVVDKEVLANLCGGMNFDAGDMTGNLREHAGERAMTVLPEPVLGHVVPLGVQARIGKEDDQTVLRGGILRLDGLDVLANGIDKAHRPPSLSAMAMRFNKV